MWATKTHASADARDFSQSLANRRQRPSHARVRSTTHRRGSSSNPLAVSERSPPLARRALLGGQARVRLDAVAGGGTEPGAGGGHRDRVGGSMLHEEPHLVIGHMAAGHERSSETEKTPTHLDRPQSPRRARPDGSDAQTPVSKLRSGYALPAIRHRRIALILIVAPVAS